MATGVNTPRSNICTHSKTDITKPMNLFSFFFLVVSFFFVVSSFVEEGAAFVEEGAAFVDEGAAFVDEETTLVARVLFILNCRVASNECLECSRFSSVFFCFDGHCHARGSGSC